jgi:hypothetical protein
MLKKSLLILVVALFCRVGAEAQQPYGISFLKTDGGYLMVDNSEDVSFRLEFKGKNFEAVKELNGSGFLIDEVLIQAITARQTEFVKPAPEAKNAPSDEQILQFHKTWESDYLGEQMGSKLIVTQENLEVRPKRKALYWLFSMPPDFESPFTHQLFLTTVIGKKVLAINGSAAKNAPVAELRKYLIGAMETLETSERPFDVKAISEKLKKAD